LLDFAAIGGTTERMEDYLWILRPIWAVVFLGWGATVMTAGIGVWKRRQWGRRLVLIEAGLVVVMGVTVAIFISCGQNDFIGPACPMVFLAIYAAWASIIMLSKSVRGEFSSTHLQPQSNNTPAKI
jgi:hypothetical protein